jgi:hypothetical protein
VRLGVAVRLRLEETMARMTLMSWSRAFGSGAGCHN